MKPRCASVVLRVTLMGSVLKVHQPVARAFSAVSEALIGSVGSERFLRIRESLAVRLPELASVSRNL
jgi:O-succinylbenzoate synthase